MEKHFGLIGYPVGHSYSQRFFQQKFERLGLQDHSYELFPMRSIEGFPILWREDEYLKGVNVTVPHKEAVLDYLDVLDSSAINVGAVNVVHKKGGDLIGYNTDYMAFLTSLEDWIGSNYTSEALILGSGGAAKAVKAALKDLKIPYKQVSRSSESGHYTYNDLTNNSEVLDQFKLIINTTPLGMHPQVDTLPDLPYASLTQAHFLYDLVYNPEETAFMQQGIMHGAKTKNGLEMLKLQAEESWNIWNT